MKIEKINDNQIKCTLNKSDLASRQIKLSELAYGTEKAKNLFRDMMQQASLEFGFEAEDIPLMIEAIPISSDSIVLVITKVEDPEELDTRFSRFAPSDDDSDIEPYDSDDEREIPMANDLIDMLNQVKNKVAAAKDADFVPLPETIEKQKPKENNNKAISSPLFKIYSFNSLNPIITVSGLIKDVYKGNNSLYKYSKDNRYYLIAYKDSHSLEEFSSICCVISEYGTDEKSTPANEAYCKEHYEIIIPKKALQKLQQLNTRRKS
jgi:adapter protein MecA 1/2